VTTLRAALSDPDAAKSPLWSGASRGRIAAAFQRSTGFLPREYRLVQRVRWAESLTVGTDAPLAQIGLEAGFCSQSHMGWAFRLVLGVSPAALRRAWRAVNQI
jgi:AraC family transcriptional regulator